MCKNRPESKSKLPKRWLNVVEAAEYIGCSPAFLNKDRQTGLHGIPFAKIGRVVRYDIAALDTFLEQAVKAAEAKAARY